jgi:hypothetical protein
VPTAGRESLPRSAKLNRRSNLIIYEDDDDGDDDDVWENVHVCEPSFFLFTHHVFVL